MTRVTGRAALAATVFLLTMTAESRADEFRLSSPDVVAGRFAPGQALSEAYGFGCSGGNRSPRLVWSGVPEGTRSFVLTLHDPDAPTGIGWMHWVVVNLPGTSRDLAGGIGSSGEGLPAGAVQTRTDFGLPGYGGPCPPVGQTHAYVLRLTALKVDRLPEMIGKDAMPALVGFFTRANALGEAVLVVRDGR